MDPALFQQFADALPALEFHKISYDRILGDQTNDYLE